ncbi:hypothetical protein SAMN06309944_1393 [Micrococcales bacterium KH10]|nr:hypothetical protein SAMN06309944_1393 [Micrococcales bacterium KH10]
MQLAGTVGMLLGVTWSLIMLPEPVDGRFPDDFDIRGMLTVLAVSFVLGMIVTITGMLTGLTGRRRTAQQLGTSRPVREILSGWQRGVGLTIVLGSTVVFFLTMFRVIQSLN